MNIPTNDFRTISLDEMDNIRLMDRLDSKFVAPVALLPKLLELMMPLFRIQIIDNNRIANYATQYLDTPTLDFYRMHRNGKLNRQKIRIRTYVDSNKSFLEVKNKNNKGRTVKKRVSVSFPRIYDSNELDGNRAFLDKHSLFDASRLVPALENAFQRMTFVNDRASERITIDINLAFQGLLHSVRNDDLADDSGLLHSVRNDEDGRSPSLRGTKQSNDSLQDANFPITTSLQGTDLSTTSLRGTKQSNLNNLMIIELKQDGRQHSDFRNILTDMRIKPVSFSKYCIGTYLTNEEVRGNRFKYKYHIINKLINQQYAAI
ncbi:MAG: polyphosphate polymerase domain-containing protein [Tannerella sp.]|jgi:hypothetical protein|nr:polyphosphate polymerase domain-containing protein [Tannerella sp.]